MSEEQDNISDQSIIIGVPVRNEGKTLDSCLLSVREAVKISKEDNIRLVICINDCDDESISKLFEIIVQG